MNTFMLDCNPVQTTLTEPTVQIEDFCQVLLHNDDHNSAEYVVDCLMRVFGHKTPLAIKIMLEAHENGKSIAEVEGESSAKKHRDQLQSCGLSSTVEKI